MRFKPKSSTKGVKQLEQHCETFSDIGVDNINIHKIEKRNRVQKWDSNPVGSWRVVAVFLRKERVVSMQCLPRTFLAPSLEKSPPNKIPKAEKTVQSHWSVALDGFVCKVALVESEGI